MKKRIFIVAAVFLAAVIFYNYVDIVATVLSFAKYNENTIEAIKIEVEPEDKLGEIAAVSLDSIFANKFNNKNIYKKSEYIAIDADALPELSKADKQYLISYFKRFNNKTIYATKEDLKKVLLMNPINNSCNGGMLLSIDKIVELKKDKAVLKVSYYINKFDAGRYDCTLTFNNDKWELEAIVPTMQP